VCIGLNFRDHAARDRDGDSKEPVIFFKATSALAGPNDHLVIPKNATKSGLGSKLGNCDGEEASYVGKESALPNMCWFCAAQ